VRIVIEATDLPGPADLRVGVQRKRRPREVLDPVAADAAAATWSFECTVRDGDVTGAYVEGPPGARFVYLSWSGGGEMFRRAKLMLDAVPADVLARAEGGTLVARLGLTDADGGPVCAAVRPPIVRWSAGPPAG
jgi:hypothetical protein